MLKVKDGDLDRMSLLYERYNKQLYGFLFRMSREKELSEDMVQNVFFKMLKYRKGFTGSGEFKTWMYHIARNMLYDHFRKEKRNSANLKIKDIEEKTAGGELADAALEKNQELRTLQIALDKLSEENRELLILFRFQELKHAEISRILNISEGAVKVRVHRALNELKSIYFKIEN